MTKHELMMSIINDYYGINFKVTDKKVDDNLDYNYIDGLIGKRKIYTSLDKNTLVITIPSFCNFQTTKNEIPFKVINKLNKMFTQHLDNFGLIQNDFIKFKRSNQVYVQSSFSSLAIYLIPWIHLPSGR